MRKLFTIFLVLLLASQTKAQVYNTPTANQQEVFLQLHRPFYLSGENLWFTLFNYDSKTGKLLTGRRFMQLSMIDRAGNVVLQERIKIYRGRTSGQFMLPSNLTTSEYLIHIGFPEEAPELFLFRKKVQIYNRSEVLKQASASTINFNNEPSDVNESSTLINAEFEKSTFSSKEKIQVNLSLEAGNAANLSVLVRPVNNQQSGYINSEQQGFESQNSRAVKALNFVAAQDHPYLLMDLKRETELKPEAQPLIFIPETHQIKAFYKTAGDVYSVDVTDVPGGVKSFYFNQFTYKRYVSPTANWDFKKDQYKDKVAYFEGEMSFSWIEKEVDFSGVISDVSLRTPAITAEVMQYGLQKTIRESMLASGGYQSIPTLQKEVVENPMMAPTLLYKKASDYEMMNNMAEYLFEIVGGIRAWDTDNRKDVRVMFGGEMFHDTPLFLVDGIPTRDVEKILALPIENLQGAGVIKFIKSKTRSKFNVEARPYGAFAGSGIVVIHLKPGASNPFRVTYDEMPKTQLYIESEQYPNPNYSEKTLASTAPDLRQILWWEPQYQMQDKQQELTFYSSELSGDYELIIQGISDTGKKVFLRKPFSVELGIK